jgi:hypothetical protein
VSWTAGSRNWSRCATACAMRRPARRPATWSVRASGRCCGGVGRASVPSTLVIELQPVKRCALR